MKFEQYLAEEAETHAALAKEEKAKADRLKANLKTSSPEYKQAMASYHYHMSKITTGNDSKEHSKQYAEHSKW